MLVLTVSGSEVGVEKGRCVRDEKTPGVDVSGGD